MKVTAIAPKLLLTPQVDQRLKHWTDIAVGEVSCLGLADRTAAGFVVSEIYLLRQTCGAAETELDDTAVAALLVGLDAAGIDVGRVRFWFHSHATFNTFWSGTDTHTIETLASGDWFVSLVVNKAGSRLARLDIRSPAHVTLDEIPVDVIHEDLGLRDACEREFSERVTEVATPVLAHSGAESSAERRLLLEGRLDGARYPGLDWDDVDDLLGPEKADMGGSMSVSDPTVRFRRQLDLLPLDKLDVPITVIGAGAVGSFTTLTLAKMGFTNLTVYDDDVVDSHNLPNQMYRLEDLGRLKVDALADLVRSFERIEIRSIPDRFTGGRLSGIVIGAVDSMASREVIWNAMRFDPAVSLFIDARMGGLVSIVRPVRPTDSADVRRYEASLHGDDDAVQEPCTARAILFCVLAIASTIARLVRADLVGMELPHEVVQDHALGIQLVT